MQVAEDAAISSLARGSLGKFVAEMDRIEERDRPCPGDAWATGRAPAEYEKARSAFSQTITKIQETVFTHVLRRYRFDDIADLHEEDRMVYDVRVEVGRRLLQMRAGEAAQLDTIMVGQIMRRYGVPGYWLLQSRLKNGGR